MSSFRKFSSKVLWLIMQVILNLVSPYSTIDHLSRLHPSMNPNCRFQSPVLLHDKEIKYQENFLTDQEPSIEIRAILVPCKGTSQKSDSNETFREYFDKPDINGIRNCRRKLMVTLKLTNVGKIKPEDEYIVVSHALDPATMQKSRLQNPYVVKIRREPVLQLYELKLEKVVNAEAREQIITSKQNNNTKCNDGTENPTCGLAFDNGVPLPYSQGFCCSCEREVDGTRRTRESKVRIGNLTAKVETNRVESANKSSNRSEPGGAYEGTTDDSELSVAVGTNNVKRKQGHFVYSSRKLKGNDVGNNVSTIDNKEIDINGEGGIKRKAESKLGKKSSTEGNSSIKDVKLKEKSEASVESSTSALLKTILFDSKMQSKGKIEPYMDGIQEEARRESRNLKGRENETSLDRDGFVSKSSYSKGSRLEKVELGRQNLMEELTELEKAYDALKKMRRNRKVDRKSERDLSFRSRIDQNFEGKERLDYSRKVGEDEGELEKVLSEIGKGKVDRDAKANENKMRETRRCFRPKKEKTGNKETRRRTTGGRRKEIKGRTRKKKKGDREDSNSVKSTETLTSRLDEFKTLSSLRNAGKSYEDQSADIEVRGKMEIPKCPSIGDASIKGNAGKSISNYNRALRKGATFDDALQKSLRNSNIGKFRGRTVDSYLDSQENEFFEILTRLLVPDEEILTNRNVSDKPFEEFSDSSKNLPRNSAKIKLAGLEKLQNPSSTSKTSENLLKKSETPSKAKESAKNIRVYVQRPDFERLDDKYLNEPSKASNSSDNPFLMDEDPRTSGIDRRIEEKFGRISEVLKEDSAQLENHPTTLQSEETTETTDGIETNKSDRVFAIQKDQERIQNVDTTKTNQGNEKSEISKMSNELNGANLNDPSNKKVSRKYTGKKVTSEEAVNPTNSSKISENWSKPRYNSMKPNDSIKKFLFPPNEERKASDSSRSKGNFFDKHLDEILPNKNAGERIVQEDGGRTTISSGKLPKTGTTNFQEFKGGTRPLEKVIPQDKSSFSSNPVNGAKERYTGRGSGRQEEKEEKEEKEEGWQESADRRNARPSNRSDEISDLIISRSRLNSKIVVDIEAEGGGAGVTFSRDNGIREYDLQNSGIVLRKMNSSKDREEKEETLVYNIQEKIGKTSGKTLGRGEREVGIGRFNEGDPKKRRKKELIDVVEDDKRSLEHEGPMEVVFYEYNFEDEKDGQSGQNEQDDKDDDDFFRKSRKLLSIMMEEENEEDGSFDDNFDSENLEYEDYTNSKTEASEVKGRKGAGNEAADSNSMTPTKRKVDFYQINNKHITNNATSSRFHHRDVDRYIKHMSEIIANHRNFHEKSNRYKNPNIDGIASKELKIVKKHVKDVPVYDVIPVQEASNEFGNVESFDQPGHLNFISKDTNSPANHLDDVDVENEDGKFYQTINEAKEKSSSIDSPSLSYNEDDFKYDRTILGKGKEFVTNSGQNAADSEKIDIFVNGNIRVEGGVKGQPISIAFVAVPEVRSDLSLESNDSNVDVSKSDDSASKMIRFDEMIGPNGSKDQEDSGSSRESLSKEFNDDLDKEDKGSSPLLLINNDNEQEPFEDNKGSLGPSRRRDPFYSNDLNRYESIVKPREDHGTSGRYFAFDTRLKDNDVGNSMSNENLVDEDDEEDETNLEEDPKSLTREKKQVEDQEEPRLPEEVSNFLENCSYGSLPVNNNNYNNNNSNNVTLIKIIPEKLFDDVPLELKNDFSSNFLTNPYNQNVSSVDLPFWNPNSMIYYDNSTSQVDSYPIDSLPNTMYFPVTLETTVQSNERLQEWNEGTTWKETTTTRTRTTTISKITEPEVSFRTTATPVRLSISNTEASFSKQIETANRTRNETQNQQKVEKGEAVGRTDTTTTSPTNLTNGDACYRLRVTVKKFDSTETTTNVPTTTTGKLKNQNEGGNNGTGVENMTNLTEKNWRIREKNKSAVANFLQKLQTLGSTDKEQEANGREESRQGRKEIIVSPKGNDRLEIIESKDRSVAKEDRQEITEENDKAGSRPKSRVPRAEKSMSVRSTSGDNVERSKITGKDSSTRRKVKKDGIFESNSKLHSANSKGSFYPSSLDSCRKGQREESTSGSSTKRSLSEDRDGSDKSFLFYARQKETTEGLPELLVKSREDIDWDRRDFTKKRVFLGRNKREEREENDGRSEVKKMIGPEERSLRDSLDVKDGKRGVDSKVSDSSWLTEGGGSRRSDKRDLEKRMDKKKMDSGVIRKLTGIRRRKKKKKKKKKKGYSGSELEIPEAKTEWRLVKRNLLSVEASQRVRVERNLDNEKEEEEEDDFGITRKTYEELEGLQVGRVLEEGNANLRKKKKMEMEKKEETKKKKKKKKEEKEEDTGSTVRRPRQSRTDGKQVRGGQDCSNRDHPVDVDESKYSESAHCLRFNDLWYSVYRLKGPILDHGVSVQLYEKRSLPDGTARWEDLTPSMIRLNTFSRRYRNNDDSLAFTYRAKREPSKQFPASLDVLEDRLLIPSMVSSGKPIKVAESKGIFDEYLVVRANEIAQNENECDKIGVGFKAFVEQPDRCGRLEGTCLKNQPLSYWKRDREAREAGRAGCYFLSNFASVPSEPIKYNVSGSGSGEFLALEYHSPHVSAIDIEVRNDYNGVASAGPFGRISHIYVDSTSPMHTLVTIVIRNLGSTPTVYRPRIVDCPRGLPVSWSNARGIVQMILPRQNGRVAFDLYGEIPSDEFECKVELLDRLGKTVAARRMRVRRMDRCYCIWHCLCACVGVADGSSCRPMSTASYRAAGFQSPLPNATTRSSSTFLGNLLDVFLFVLSFLALLLTMGILKWIIGIYVPAVGRWGLDTLLESTRMVEYFEEELKCRCIVTDEYGLPVHPDTGSRSIRICSRKAEFLLNVTFFLIYPIAVCCHGTKKILGWGRRDSITSSNDESKACLATDGDEYRNLVTVSTYGDIRNSKMEADDTSYVMNELKKSQESLQEYNRYRRFRYYMENQDSR